MKVEGGYLIGRIKLLSGRILNKLLNKNSLQEFTGEQGKILYSLWQEDNISSSKLATQTGLALNTLTRMIEHLERKGLVIRQADSKDKRIKLICLTDRGRSLETATIATNEQMNRIFYRDFTNDEIIAFEKMLKKIENNLMEAQIDERIT